MSRNEIRNVPEHGNGHQREERPSNTDNVNNWRFEAHRSPPHDLSDIDKRNDPTSSDYEDYMKTEDEDDDYLQFEDPELINWDRAYRGWIRERQRKKREQRAPLPPSPPSPAPSRALTTPSPPGSTFGETHRYEQDPYEFYDRFIHGEVEEAPNRLQNQGRHRNGKKKKTLVIRKCQESQPVRDPNQPSTSQVKDEVDW